MSSSATELKQKGTELVRLGKHKEAAQAYQDAIKLNPTDVHLYHSNLSMCYHALNDATNAEQAARKAIEAKPDWAKGHARLGNALLLAAKPAEAVAAYAAGLAVEPANVSLLELMMKAQSSLTGAPAPDAAAAAAAAAPPADDLVIGIDLGTTYSAVGVIRPGAGRVEMVPNREGANTTPSWVAFSAQDGTRLVGQAAKNQAAANPANTVNDAKRLIGRPFSDPAVAADIKHLSCKVVEGDSGKPVVRLTSDAWGGEAREFAPEQVSAMVLEQLKADAEAFLGAPVKRAVITVPAHFNDAQRNATKDAGAIAGLNVIRIINEPTAAAIAYGLDKGGKGKKAERKVLIFDLGGGTFDVSILAMEGGIFEVKATGGDTRLGGEDFDAVTSKFLSDQFARANPGAGDISERGLRRLKAAAERAKRQLSTSTTTEVDIDSLADGVDFKLTLTRAKFEALNAAAFNRCIDTVKTVLKDSGYTKEDIDDVVLVGGSTRVPKIRALLTEFFNGKALCSSINPDEAVAYGAAVQAGVLSGGLAAAGGALAKASSGLVLMDVVPLSLGIETTGRVMSTVVKRNTPIPCRKSDTFTTEEDDQTAVDVVIYEGERASTEACNELGKFTISGLERAKRGEPQVLVTFDIDANGILSVTAMDKKTNARASTTIEATASRNSPADVEKMVEDAKRHAAADAALRVKADARRALEDVIYDLLDSSTVPEAARADAEAAEAWIAEDYESISAHEMNEKAAALRRRARAA